MPYEFRFPDVGEGIAEGELVKWRVKAGENVKADQVIAEMETDKAVVEIPSPRAGVILELRFKEGDTVKVGDVLVVIGEEGEAFRKKKIPEKAEERMEAPKKDAGTVVGLLDIKEKVIPLPQEKPQPEKTPQISALPYVRRLAKEKGIDLTKLTGIGPGGRITKEDVEKAAAAAAVQAPAQKPPSVGLHTVRKYDMWGYVEHVPLRGVRKTTARKMVESFFTIPHVTHMDECDVSNLWELRSRMKEKFAKQAHITFLPFVIKAIIAGLKEFRMLNSSLDEDNGDIIVKKYYNIGIAVDVEEGLMVPVIKIADQKSILDIAKEIEGLIKKAESRTLDLQDMKGGTFTVTNVGTLGGHYATPIINYPEAAILAVGKIYDKPVVKNGKVVVRKYLPLSLSFDHRIVDGAYAARFTNAVMRHLEDPDLMLVERD